MRTLINFLFFLVFTVFLLPQAGFTQNSIPQFGSEQAAQQHCHEDTVVWVNTSTGVYHFQGQRWYANTKHGAFVCRKEADKGGDRATRNGQ